VLLVDTSAWIEVFRKPAGLDLADVGGLDQFEEAAALYGAARRAGFTVRSGIDCLIAACAIRHGLTVPHNDRDLALLGKIAGLRERNLTGARSRMSRARR